MAAPSSRPLLGKPKKRSSILISACLAGINCNHRGENELLGSLKPLMSQFTVVAVCPEVLGGLPVPREAAEISGGEGKDVLDGTARVVTRSGRDVTAKFVLGAREALKIAAIYRPVAAILRSNSPSCGYGRIYDGSFKKRLRRGSGLLAALLKRDRIKVYTEKTLAIAKRKLEKNSGYMIQ
ncbi:MAG: DUF523 domain-containing protein [Candidatus Omnitrophota bacterium]